jgi:hypothetical protein
MIRVRSQRDGGYVVSGSTPASLERFSHTTRTRAGAHAIRAAYRLSAHEGWQVTRAIQGAGL